MQAFVANQSVQAWAVVSQEEVLMSGVVTNWPSVSLLVPILLLLVVYASILGLLYRIAAGTAYAKAFFKASTPAAILAVLNLGALFLIALASAAQFAHDKVDFAYSVACATFGLGLGWILGIVISPGSKDESSEFSLLTKAVSTFLTGYVLGYIKDLKLSDVEHFLERPGVPFRLILATACCFSTVAVVFVVRRAEIIKSAMTKEWFIAYSPRDPVHTASLRSDLLACGPFGSREDASAQIELLKVQDKFRDLVLAPIRIEMLGALEASELSSNGKAKANQVVLADK